MTVWITGAHGFIGRHTARAFADAGHTVVGLGHGVWPEDAHREWGVARWRDGDVTRVAFDTLASDLGLPDTVVHLAGGSTVGASFLQPAEDFRRSVTTTAELAEWLRLQAPRAALVLASSAAVYGAGHDGPIVETAACTPYSPYGFHKRMAESVLESHARNFGLRVAVVRLFSVYGPGLRKQLLWEACSRLAAGAEVLELGGTGDEQRDWLHVEDATRLLVLAARQASSEVWLANGGTGVAARVRDVAQGLAQAMGRPLPVRFDGRSRRGDPDCLVADTSRLRDLGFVPHRAWPEGMAAYVDWFRAAREPRSRGRA